MVNNTFYYRKKSKNYHQFGSPSIEVYEKWSPHVCSICCLKMVGDTFGLTNEFSLYQLTMKALKLGVFTENKQTGEISGAFHKPLVELAGILGLKGRVEKRLTINKVKQHLKEGKFVLLSIDSNQTGSHLILVHTFIENKNSFIIHDSEQILGENGENIKLTQDQLNHFSNYKGISLWID